MKKNICPCPRLCLLLFCAIKFVLEGVWLVKFEMYGFDPILLKTYPNWLGDRALNQLFTEMEQNQDSVHKVINPPQ
jgi:hypothetical protein